jgi:hypothetical protein
MEVGSVRHVERSLPLRAEAWMAGEAPPVAQGSSATTAALHDTRSSQPNCRTPWLGVATGRHWGANSLCLKIGVQVDAFGIVARFIVGAAEESQSNSRHYCQSQKLGARTPTQPRHTGERGSDLHVAVVDRRFSLNVGHDRGRTQSGHARRIGRAEELEINNTSTNSGEDSGGASPI